MTEQFAGIASRTHAVAVYAALNSLRREPGIDKIHCVFMLAEHDTPLPLCRGVPESYVAKGVIMLNLSMSATPCIELVNDFCIHIPQIRFNGVATQVTIPFNYIVRVTAYDSMGGEVHVIDYEPFRDSSVIEDDTPTPPKRPTLRLVE